MKIACITTSRIPSNTANSIQVMKACQGLARLGHSVRVFAPDFAPNQPRPSQEQLAEQYGLEFLGAIPLDPTTVVAGDLGTPVVLLDGDCPAKRALLELGERVAAAAQSSLEAASTVHK